MNTKEVIRILKHGGVGVMPTDTIYGLVASAFSKQAIKRVYEIKKRNKNKKSIILISSISDLKKFRIKPSQSETMLLKTVWPGPVSVIMSGTAFRLPKKKSLVKTLSQTGPLIAPSANPEGLPPARTIREAKKYFGNQIDFYISGGKLKNRASTLIKIKNNKIEVLRQGDTKVKL